jgi:hypothetical protein
LVEQILKTKKDVDITTLEQEKNYIERKISSLETSIDEHIYRLYDLSMDEIKIIEAK